MQTRLKIRLMNPHHQRIKGFTVLELIVAVAVTAVLTGMLLLISTQVLETQSSTNAELERNQVAHFVLDQIQEDLQCALFRNDGNVWMALSILNESGNSGSWVEASKTSFAKSPLNSLRIKDSDWPTGALQDSEIDSLGQGPFHKSRFGVAGTWLRFFTQSPELDPQANGNGSARAVAYQIIRYGITGSTTSRKRYHLFRSDVSAKNTFEAGYNLHPDNESGYGINASNISVDLNSPNTPRVPSTIINPIIEDGTDYPATSFSLATNIIDFGIRAYRLEKNSFGTGNLVQLFPPIKLDSPGNLLSEEFYATSHKLYQEEINDPTFYQFPDVVDVMVRVLSEEGARILENYENGSFPNIEEVDWWSIAEEHSKVYFRRIKIYGSGI
jgi:type II secretory pathway pseudopilin PulG